MCQNDVCLWIWAVSIAQISVTCRRWVVGLPCQTDARGGRMKTPHREQRRAPNQVRQSR